MSNLSSDPEADTDTLNDDELLEAYLATGQKPLGTQPVEVPDWPPCPASLPVFLDPLIVAWFKARHADWQDEIEFVLRAWITAHGPAHESSACEVSEETAQP